MKFLMIAITCLILSSKYGQAAESNNKCQFIGDINNTVLYFSKLDNYSSNEKIGTVCYDLSSKVRSSSSAIMRFVTSVITFPEPQLGTDEAIAWEKQWTKMNHSFQVTLGKLEEIEGFCGVISNEIKEGNYNLKSVAYGNTDELNNKIGQLKESYTELTSLVNEAAEIENCQLIKW